MKPSLDEHRSYGFEQLADLCSRLDAASDDELLATTHAWCDPAAIREGKLPNGSNQVALLGLVIAEAGRRQLIGAAPVIAEFCAWPAEDDFWVHLVPRALRALKSIGDLTVIPRLLQIAERTASVEFEASIATMRGDLPEPRERTDSVSPTGLSLEAEAAIVRAAIDVGVLNRDGVVSWADHIIEKEAEPPWWLCDLAVATGIKECQELLRSNSEAPTVCQQLQVLAWAVHSRRLVLPEALTRMWYVFLDAEMAKDAREDLLVELLFGAVLEWFHQETAVQEWRDSNLSVRDRLLARWFEDMGKHGPAIDGPVVDAWLSPETLDRAGKALHRRIVAVINAVVADAPEVCQALGCVECHSP